MSAWFLDSELSTYLFACQYMIEILYKHFNVITFLIQWTAGYLANYTSCSLNFCKGSDDLAILVQWMDNL